MFITIWTNTGTVTDRPRVLVGSIGTSDYDQVTYEFEDRTVDAQTSPVALCYLFDIDGVFIFRTQAAGEENDDVLAAGFEDAEVAYEFVDIDPIATESDIDSVLSTVTRTLDTSGFYESSIVLDISHSFRSIPIVLLLSLVQFETLHDAVAVERIYYSRFAGSDDYETTPIIDFTHVQTLLKWYDAVQTAKRTGSLGGISTLLEEKRESLFTGAEPGHHARHAFNDFVAPFGAAQEDIDAGFPLGAGLNTRAALDALAGLDAESFVGPSGMILDPLELMIQDFATTQTASKKTELELNEDELKREAEMVQFYIEHGKFWIALEVGRELFVNRLLYDNGHTADWLDPEVRATVRPTPGHHESEGLTLGDEAQRLWDKIRTARNNYAHAGFKKQNRPSTDAIQQSLTKLCERINDDTFWES